MRRYNKSLRALERVLLVDASDQIYGVVASASSSSKHASLKVLPAARMLQDMLDLNGSSQQASR